MEIKRRVMPLLLSGTLAFGTMGVPLSAYAGTVDQYNSDSVGVNEVAADLNKRVQAGDLEQARADQILANFRAMVEQENAAAKQAALEQAEAEAAAAAAAEAEAAAVAQAQAVEDEGEDVDGAENSSSGTDSESGSATSGDDDGSDDATNSDSGYVDEDGDGYDDNTGERIGGDDGEDSGNTGGYVDEDGDGYDDNTGERIGGDDDSSVNDPDDPDDPGYIIKPGEGVVDKPSIDKKKPAKTDTKGKTAKHAKQKTAEEKYREASKKFAERAAQSAKEQAAEAVQSNLYQSAYTSSNQNYTPIRYSTNLSTEMFIASIGEQARQIGQDKNLYASVMIAQAIVESDSGNSGLAQAPNNNLFGIKGSYEGQSVTMATQEDNGKGNLYNIDAAFRKYDTKEDSLKDYAELLRGDMSHYYKAWKENAPTYKDAAQALQGTYATSTIYADTLCAVIEAYDLTRFDKPLDFKIEGKHADGKKYTMDDYAQLEANAVSFLGTPYVWGGTTPDGFDCSGFVQYLYKQTFGISLPRTTYTQQYEGVEVSFDELQMGDLLFFNEGGSTEHVAMYLGDGFYIHAPEPGDSIKITDMNSFKPSFAKRIIKTEPTSGAAKKADSAKAKKTTDSDELDKKIANAKHAKTTSASKKADAGEADAKDA